VRRPEHNRHEEGNFMTRTTTRLIRRISLSAVALAVVALVAPNLASAGEITIQVSPNTLNLASEGKVVTVHTDIAYSAVNVYSVWLSGVPISSWKADDRGNFVAKFVMTEVKGIPDLEPNGMYEFVFDGETTSGEPIWGSTEVKIIDRG
jgi:hypothetical protein